METSLLEISLIRPVERKFVVRIPDVLSGSEVLSFITFYYNSDGVMHILFTLNITTGQAISSNEFVNTSNYKSIDWHDTFYTRFM